VLVVAAALVFLSVTGGTFFLVLRFGVSQVRPLDRLQFRAPVVSEFLPAPGLIWKELVSWAGRAVPGSPKSLPLRDVPFIVCKLLIIRTRYAAHTDVDAWRLCMGVCTETCTVCNGGRGAEAPIRTAS